ncbi:MAG: hypothetical protein ACLVES_01885 [Faecalibacterium prausnitzii]
MASFSGIKNTLLAEQVDEEAAPAHGPNLKTARPRSDMLQGLLSFFMEKNHASRVAAALIIQHLR